MIRQSAKQKFLSGYDFMRGDIYLTKDRKAAWEAARPYCNLENAYKIGLNFEKLFEPWRDDNKFIYRIKEGATLR